MTNQYQFLYKYGIHVVTVVLLLEVIISLVKIVYGLDGMVEWIAKGTLLLLFGILFPFASRLLLQDLKHIDDLTLLPNKISFNEEVNRLLKDENRRLRFSVFLLGLDDFKDINDTLGHGMGDLVLKEVANRLKNHIGQKVYRLGGDEFLILVDEPCCTEDKISSVSTRILNIFSTPFYIKNNEINLSTSIGISLYPNNGLGVDSLLKHADIALYQAKIEGKKGYRVFDQEMKKMLLDRKYIEKNLRHALRRNELELLYQPKLDIRSHRITGFECLLRWNNKEKGYISPENFIPIAESTGLIIPIGEWILKQACILNKRLQDQGFPQMKVAVNISPVQFQQGLQLVQTINKILKEIKLDAQWLEVEITESTLIRNKEQAIHILRQLKGLGIKVSLDDFGTGYSSLSYLRLFPIDCLKIDKSFMDDAASNNTAAIISTIISMAHRLNMEVVAEGVEISEQLEFLIREKCDEIQGYLFSRPLDSYELEALLKNSNS